MHLNTIGFMISCCRPALLVDKKFVVVISIISMDSINLNIKDGMFINHKYFQIDNTLFLITYLL